MDNGQGTAAVSYSTRADAENAIAKFDNQEFTFNNITTTIRVRMLGSSVSVSGESANSNSTGFFRAAMDDPK